MSDVSHHPIQAGSVELTSSSKDDVGKRMVSSLVFGYFPRALRAVAEVSEYGMRKYNADPGDRGFLDVDDAERRYTDALGRHLLEDLEGQVINHEDGGVRVDAQIAWNALARIEYRLIEEERRRRAGADRMSEFGNIVGGTD